MYTDCIVNSLVAFFTSGLSRMHKCVYICNNVGTQLSEGRDSTTDRQFR